MKHSIAQLQYRVIEGAVSLEPLQVRADRSLEWRNWRVTVFVLGASHAVRFVRDDEILTELLTCLPPRFEQATCREIISESGGEPGVVCFQPFGLTWRCRITPFGLSGADDLCGAFGPENRLDADYPLLSIPDDPPILPFHAPASLPQPPTFAPKLQAMNSVPRTCIGWEIEGDRLCLETLHTYPEEGRGVRTETLCEFTPKIARDSGKVMMTGQSDSSAFRAEERKTL